VDRKKTAEAMLLVFALTAIAASVWWLTRPSSAAPRNPPPSATLAAKTQHQASSPSADLAVLPSIDAASPPAAPFASLFDARGDYIGPEITGISAREYETLRSKAEAGDVVAATQLYMTLFECHRLLTNTPTIAEVNARGYSPEGAARALLEREAELEHCAAVPAGAVAARADWLVKAAEAGFWQAQGIYSVHGEYLLGGMAGMVADPQAVQRYKDTKMRYLTTAAARRNLSAMLSLSDTYRAGVTAPQDLVAAHGLRIAGRTLYPDSMPQIIVDISAEGLSAAQLRAAEVYARQFIQRTGSGS
jgi:hypothetical protein